MSQQVTFEAFAAEWRYDDDHWVEINGICYIYTNLILSFYKNGYYKGVISHPASSTQAIADAYKHFTTLNSVAA